MKRLRNFLLRVVGLHAALFVYTLIGGVVFLYLGYSLEDGFVLAKNMTILAFIYSAPAFVVDELLNSRHGFAEAYILAGGLSGMFALTASSWWTLFVTRGGFVIWGVPQEQIISPEDAAYRIAAISVFVAIFAALYTYRDDKRRREARMQKEYFGSNPGDWY